VSTSTCLQGRGDVSPVNVPVDSQKLARRPRRNCRALLPLDGYMGTVLESDEAHEALLFPNYCSKPDGSSMMQMRAPQHVFELPCRGTELPHYSDARISIREGSCLLLHAENDVPLNLQNLTIKGVLCTVL
jgi:hypothetical protein